MAEADQKVVVMPGVERRDLAGELVPSVEVLQRAIENGVTDVVVVGKGRDGRPYLASEAPDVDRVTGILFGAATFLSTHNVKR